MTTDVRKRRAIFGLWRLSSGTEGPVAPEQRTRSWTLARIAALVACVTLSLLTIPVDAGAVPWPCTPAPGHDYCVTNGSGPASGGGGPPSPVASPPSSPRPPECTWDPIGDDRLTILTIADAYRVQGRPSPQQRISWLGFCADARPDVVPHLVRWVAHDDTATRAAALVQRLEGQLPQPTVVTSPPLDRAAIIGVPVFVTVSNWQRTLTVTDTLAGTTVTLTARAQLTYDPAEPGAGPVTCVAGGTPYDPSGGDLWGQAASGGACAHAYRHRTGAAGRPAQWPAAATVTWSLSWRADDGSSGTLPPVTRRVPTPRAVHEVQALVTRSP